MKFKKCPLCDQIKPLVFHITELKDGKLSDYFSLCHECASVYLGDKPLQEKEPKEKEPKEKVVLLSFENIQTPEQLLQFIASHESFSIDSCPGCKMTWEEFDKHGRFGCSYCYEHFQDIINPILDRYHGNSHHIGKRPKKELEKNPEEKQKILKLKMSHAIEHENYEQAAEIKKELDLIDDDCD